jgi:hypothetical protein
MSTVVFMLENETTLLSVPKTAPILLAMVFRSSRNRRKYK